MYAIIIKGYPSTWPSFIWYKLSLEAHRHAKACSNIYLIFNKCTS